MNIRKWLCGIARKNKWKTLKNLCQCDKYYPIPEPEPIRPAPPEPPIPPEPPPPPPPPPKPERPDALIGTSHYQMMECKLADIDWFLDEGYYSGWTATEAFTSYTWSRGVNWQPYINVGTATEPMFNYTKEHENPAYFEKLEYIMTGCAKRDTALVIRLLDYCSVANPDYYEKLCWHHSVQKTNWQDVQHKAWGGFYGHGPRPYYSAFMKRIVGLAAKTKCRVIYHAVNEAGYKPSKKELAGWLLKLKSPTAMKDKIILEFHQWMADELRRLGAKLSIISTNLDYVKNREWAAANGIYFEVHGCNSPERLTEVFKLGKTYMANGDGPDKLAKGRQGDKPEKREPSVSQGTEMGQILKAGKKPMYLYYNRNAENPLPSDIRRARFDVLKAIVKAMI